MIYSKYVHNLCVLALTAGLDGSEPISIEGENPLDLLTNTRIKYTFQILTSSARFAKCGIVLAMYRPPKPTAAIPSPAKIMDELMVVNII